LHGQAGSHGPLGVVFVSERCTEEGKDGVADDLVDSPTECGDVEHEALETAINQVLDVLGVARFRHRREPDKIGEQDRDDSPLVGAMLEWLPAGRAEA
jgi:hypothetical protein